MGRHQGVTGPVFQGRSSRVLERPETGRGLREGREVGSRWDRRQGSLIGMRKVGPYKKGEVESLKGLRGLNRILEGGVKR